MRRLCSCFVKVDIGCYVYSTEQDSVDEPACIILARGVQEPANRSTMTNPMLLAAEAQDRTFAMSKSKFLPGAYGWCFGGPDALGLQAAEHPSAVMKWKAYAPFKHLWNQIATSATGKAAIPRVHSHITCTCHVPLASRLSPGRPPGHRWLCALLALPMPPFLAMRGHIRHLLSPRLIAWPCVATLSAALLQAACAATHGYPLRLLTTRGRTLEPTTASHVWPHVLSISCL